MLYGTQTLAEPHHGSPHHHMRSHQFAHYPIRSWKTTMLMYTTQHARANNIDHC